MSKGSFEDIGMVTATFAAREDMKPGQVVKITGNGEVGACTDGDAFCGLALSVRSGFAGVQVKGFACLPTSGTVTLGRVKLAADGTGGVSPVCAGGTVVLGVSAAHSGPAGGVCRAGEIGGLGDGKSVRHHQAGKGDVSGGGPLLYPGAGASGPLRAVQGTRAGGAGRRSAAAAAR